MDSSSRGNHTASYWAVKALVAGLDEGLSLDNQNLWTLLEEAITWHLIGQLEL
jgi:hypothetical protein